MSLKYRPEIDGLRTVAVLAVVFYHAGLRLGPIEPFSGGYIGVDVFFVISGYLIGLIILGELREGRFSFRRFYLRRARRILPALFVVIATCLAFGWVFLLPSAFEDLAGSAVGALFFGSNVWFWRDGGYSADPSALKPLLHTWSLAVEEQFYIFFPVLALVMWRFGRRYLAGLWVMLALVSVQAAEFGSERFRDATFYLLPTRAWELLAGVFLAEMELTFGRRGGGRLVDAVVPPVGLFLIANAIVFMDDSTPHPAFRTVLPVLGTALVIWAAHPGELVGAMLASRPFVWIGRISYSLYLWHWPVFVFRRIISVAPIGRAESLALVGLSFLLAIASFLLVEQPMRSPRRVATRVFVPLAAAGFAGLALASALTLQGQGFPARMGVLGDIFAGTGMQVLRQDGRDCNNRPVEAMCSFGPADGPRLVLLGDSHAGVLAPSLLEVARRHGMRFLTHSEDGCVYLGPAVEVWRKGLPRDACVTATAARHAVLRDMPPSTIVLLGRWPALISGQPFDNGEGGVEAASGADSWAYQIGAAQDGGPGDGPDLERAIRAGITELLEAGHRVVLVSAVPEAGWHVSYAIRSRLNGVGVAEYRDAFAAIDLSTALDRYRARNARAEAIFAGLPAGPGLIRIHPERIFCDAARGRCLTHDAGAILYHDDDHLSAEGNRRLAAAIEAALAGSGGFAVPVAGPEPEPATGLPLD